MKKSRLIPGWRVSARLLAVSLSWIPALGVFGNDDVVLGGGAISAGPVALPHSSALHPEHANQEALMLVPREVRVPVDWTQAVLATAPHWKLAVRGPGIPRGEMGVRIHAESPGWNLYGKLWLALDIENRGAGEVLVRGGLRHPMGPVGAEVIGPGETRTLAILISRELKADHAHLARALGGIVGLPGGQVRSWRTIDATSIKTLTLHVSSTVPDIHLVVSALRGVVDFDPPAADQLAGVADSLLDRFGQNRHEVWSGKIHQESELREQARREDAELELHPRPASWNRFGGWQDGPQLEATGHFRTAQYKERWWLVDPDGRLFWSFGINCVIAKDHHAIGRTTTPGIWRALGDTPSDEPQPSELPGIEAEERWHPYMANLYRKYGASWRQDAADRAHRRMASWGINTLGNWSGPEVTGAGRTPYVKEVHFGRPALQYGRTHYQEGLPDVFDDRFEASLRRKVSAVARDTADDPWCIGYFVENELPFRSTRQIAEALVTAPPARAAKQAFVLWVREMYPSLEGLNRGWGTEFGSWSALAESAVWPDSVAFEADAHAFARLYLDRYFRICRAAVNEFAPDKLYLGSRMNHYFPDVFEACARHADVVSINYYDYSPVALPLLRTFEADKPFLIGEFHFGTLTEQGVWGPGLAHAKDLAHSARLLKRYVSDGLADPRIVGAHWFQYADQPATGRGDGENFRVGFISITDGAHAALVEAARSIGANLYELRLRGEPKGAE